MKLPYPTILERTEDELEEAKVEIKRLRKLYDDEVIATREALEAVTCRAERAEARDTIKTLDALVLAAFIEGHNASKLSPLESNLTAWEHSNSRHMADKIKKGK